MINRGGRSGVVRATAKPLHTLTPPGVVLVDVDTRILPTTHTHTPTHTSIVNHPPPKGNEVLQHPSLHNSCSLTRNINTSEVSQLKG